MKLPVGWQNALGDAVQKPSFRKLEAFLVQERANKVIFPPERDVFRALELTPLEAVKVVLLGQDPYHDAGQAHGLCFSVRSPSPPPPSLKNVFRELREDLGTTVPEGYGDLSVWAERGVLLLNTVLTVVAHEAASHKKKGWEEFTDAVIRAVNDRPSAAVFCLWGAHAQKKAELIDASRHAVIRSAHPSPLSVRLFRGSRPFSQMNEALVARGHTPIDWSLDDGSLG